MNGKVPGRWRRRARRLVRRRWIGVRRAVREVSCIADQAILLLRFVFRPGSGVHATFHIGEGDGYYRRTFHAGELIEAASYGQQIRAEGVEYFIDLWCDTGPDTE